MPPSTPNEFGVKGSGGPVKGDAKTGSRPVKEMSGTENLRTKTTVHRAQQPGVKGK